MILTVCVACLIVFPKSKEYNQSLPYILHFHFEVSQFINNFITFSL